MIAELIARMRSLWSGIFRTQRVDADLQEEFRLHMEMRAADLVRAGMAPVDAAGKARAEFGSSADFVDKARRARGLAWFDELRFSWLDVKLGGRMIYRYPGLTVIGGLAMGVAIALGAGVMGVIALLSDPKIPLDEGERIVGIQVWGTLSNNAERRIAYDLATWKSELQTVRDIGAFRGSNVLRAVGANDGRADPGRAAEMNASGFRVARVNALLGRYLVDADERPAAPLVVVLGYDIWSGRFGADSTIVGRSVKIGGIDHTVVGVMPQGFAWPINHNLWVPLRLDPNILPRQGPPLYVFGRLAPAVSLEAGQAEIATLGDRIAKESPKTHDHLRARILPFAQSWFELDSPETQLMYRAAQIAATLLLVIICVHIAILVYARTATRHGEIAVRSALGASRSRIVAQLVGEALVLAGVGAAVGLALIAVIAAQMDTILIETGANSVIPFWMKIGVSAESVGFLIALAVLAALIIGVVPALQVTGRRVQATLQRLAGGHGSVRMGKLWTSLVIVEVAITVAVLPWSVFITSKTLEAVLTGHGFPAEEILMAELSVNREQNEAGAREEDSLYARRATELRYEVMRRLEADPNVAGVSFSAGIPGSESSGRIEIDSMPVKFLSGSHTDGRTWANWSEDRQIVRLANVDASFFDALAVTPLIGRTFKPSDAAPGANVAVVNRTFVDSIFKGANPIGRKFRELGNPGMGPDPQYRGPWQEIVGVVPNVPAMVDWEDPRGVWYSPTRNVEPATLLIHVRGTGPLSLATRLRAITTEVDLGMFLRRVQTLDEGLWKTHLPMRLVTTALIAVTLSVLILSAAGLYALMSVIVTQRRREIGIRIALGADRRRVLTGIFSRAALQVGAGIAVGLAIAGVVLWVSGSDVVGFNALVIMPAVSLFMLGVGALAALGPARRGLAIQPSVVLKED